MADAQTVAQTRITLSGFSIPIDGTWQTKDGGNLTMEVSREKEGGELFKEDVKVLPGTRDNVTVSRSYKTDRDSAVRRWAERGRGERGTLTEQEIDDDELPIGRPFVYKVRLAGVALPSTDSNGADRKRLELTFAIEGEVG